MEKEMEKVKSAIEDFGKKVVDAVKKGKDEADKVTKIAQVKIEIGSLNRQMRDLYQELGELFYRNLSKPSKKGEVEVAEAVAHLREVEKNINSLKRTLKAVREDKTAAKKGRPSAPAAAAKASKGKRGRPPKAAGAAKGETAKRRGRPPKAAAAKAKSTATKRRGRPPKTAASDKS